MTNPALELRERFRLTERMIRLQRAAAERGSDPKRPLVRRDEGQGRFFFGTYKDLPLAERQARSFADALADEPVLLFPGERVNGLFYGGADPQYYGVKEGSPWWAFGGDPNAEARRRREVPELDEFVGAPGDSYLIAGWVAPGHVAWNYDLILAHGVDGLIRRHREALAGARDVRAREYYEGAIVSLEGVLAWNRRHVEALRERLAAAATAEERASIAENIAVMERVPAQPARTFREAVQSFYFQWLCVMYDSPWGGNSPGRLDYFLWPYLRAEYESGALSYQDAAELVAELFVKMDERVHLSDGHVNTIVVGGSGPDGGDAVNPLSWIMIDVFEQLDLTHPAVYTRLSEANPPEYAERCVDFLIKGRNRAQILADEPIIAAMTRGGRMRREDAAMYVCGGCMELNPHGMNSDLLFSFTYNVPKALELLVTGGRCLVAGRPRLRVARSLADCADFESFYAAFESEMRRHLTAKFRQLDIHSEEWAKWRPNFLLSSMIADCLERGRSQQDGGARYPDYGGTPLGIQNAADSLTAIKTAVFEERFCSAAELVAALAADFQGWETLHARLKAIPKYGSGDAGADAMMNRVLASVCGIFDGYTNRHGGRVKPIIFTFVWAPEMGRALGASPDGRRAGAPIAHGLTPQAAGMSSGLTAAIGSLTSLELERVSGGASTMWDIDPGWVSPAVLSAMVRVFVRQGGQIFQGNTTSVEDLQRAMETPAAYPNLIVRVGGFSARFTQLGRDCQMEIARRYRHAR